MPEDNVIQEEINRIRDEIIAKHFPDIGNTIKNQMKEMMDEFVVRLDEEIVANEQEITDLKQENKFLNSTGDTGGEGL